MSIPANRARRLIFPLVASLMLLIAQVLPRLQGRPAYLNVDIKALGYFPFDSVSGATKDVPAKWRALDGAKVRMWGFMHAPTLANGSVREFQVVHNVNPSRFERPQVQERVFAKANTAVPYRLNDLTEVCGTLHVKVVHDPDDGRITSVYTLDVDSAQSLDSQSNVEPLTIELTQWLNWIGAVALFVWGFRVFLKMMAVSYRVKPGICEVCGYDLRASRGRCPECGNVYDGAQEYAIRIANRASSAMLATTSASPVSPATGTPLPPSPSSSGDTPCRRM